MVETTEQEKVEPIQTIREQTTKEMSQLITYFANSTNPEAKTLARLSTLVALDVLFKVMDVTSSYTENDRKVLGIMEEIVNDSSKIDRALLDLIESLLKRVAKLEKTQQPTTELENLKSNLAKTQGTIDEYKDTLVELEAIRTNKFQKWIQTLEDKGKKPNGG